MQKTSLKQNAPLTTLQEFYHTITFLLEYSWILFAYFLTLTCPDKQIQPTKTVQHEIVI